MSFGSRLREARKGAKITQEQLGNMIGAAKSSIAGYEKGTSHPTEERIISMMRVLGVDANYLWQDEIPTKKPATPKGEQPVDVESMELAHEIMLLSPENKARMIDYLALLGKQDNP